MPTLTVGRVAYDVTVSKVDNRSRDSNRTVTLTGVVDGTVTLRKNLRSELLAQTGRLVAVSYTSDSDVDGFYILRSVDVGAMARQVAYFDHGLFRVTIRMERVGSESETEIQSLITGTVLTNAHGLDAGETAPFHAPAVGHLAYNSVDGTPTQRTRTGDEGAVEWYDGIDNTVDPTWSVAPSSFYDGSAKIYVTSILRAGTDAPNDVDDFELSNSLVKVTPGTTTGSSNGRLDVSWYDGAQWDTAMRFKIIYDAAGGANVIPGWHYMSIIRNDAEVCILRLVRDAAPATSAHRHVLDLMLRRGSRFVSCFYTWTGAAEDWDVIRDSNDAASAFTPTGASSAVGVVDDSATDNNKFVIATAAAHSARTTEGGVRITGPTQTFDFMIGAEVGATPGTGNDADELALQYFGWIAERDRAVRR